MVEKKENNGVWKYYWTAGGMLKAVQRPDGSVITFKYDAFGRRISKSYHRREFLYIWDKNVPLHEIQKEELCEDNIITWIFDGFTPTAKLINGKAYSIISDHIGTPLMAIDTNGVKVWERELDIYGRVRKEFTSDDVKDRRCGFMPFLYQGQYYDKETELVYNRFRYYSPDTGAYISQDPIGLAGGNPTLYGYVEDTNTWVDIFGLRSNSAQLARNLKDAPAKNHAAHHIVMTGTNDAQMNSLIAQMNAFNIDIDGADNGIWLPIRDSDKVQGGAQTSHQQDGLHGKAYKQEIFDRLNGKDKKEFLKELTKIKQELNEGRTWETKTTKKLKKCIR